MIFLLQNRLLESLAKFQEYEDTLESIMHNLDQYEPMISEEIATPLTGLKAAHELLDQTRVRFSFVK